MNSVKEIDIKNRMYYFSDDINMRNLGLNKIKIDEKSYKYILIYYIGYVKTNNVKPLHLIINKIIKYIEESNGNKYLALVPANKSKATLKSVKNYGAKSDISN